MTECVGDGFYVGDVVELADDYSLSAPKGAKAKVIGPGRYHDTMKVEWLDSRYGQTNGGYSRKMFKLLIPSHPTDQQQPQNQQPKKKIDYFAITKGIIGR